MIQIKGLGSIALSDYFSIFCFYINNVSYIKVMDIPPSPSSAPTGALVFQRWLGAESNKAFHALRDEPQSVYETIWNAWLESLQPSTDKAQPCPPARIRQWNEARAEDVARFLRIRAGQRAHHEPERQLSEVTRRRYWRVLDRVYAYAVQQGWLETSPVAHLPRAERPRAVEQLGHCLPPALWARLPAQFPDSDCLQGARDRAILLLLYDLALAPEEVRALTDDCLLDDLRQPWTPSCGASPAALHIVGARKAQQRTLPLTPRLGTALAAWLQYRQAHNPELTGRLFHSRKGGGPLSIRALFHVASKVIHQAHADTPSSTQQWPLHRVGPQVMRNTAIVTWLRAGLSEMEIVRRIGVENTRALGHLRHQLETPTPGL